MLDDLLKEDFKIFDWHIFLKSSLRVRFCCQFADEVTSIWTQWRMTRNILFYWWQISIWRRWTSVPNVLLREYHLIGYCSESSITVLDIAPGAGTRVFVIRRQVWSQSWRGRCRMPGPHTWDIWKYQSSTRDRVKLIKRKHFPSLPPGSDNWYFELSGWFSI